MSQIERIPPHNDEAEKCVLGAILIESDVFYSVSDILVSDDFYSDAHKEIFIAMTDLHLKTEPIDVITVVESLKRRKTLEAVGGRSYIAELSNVVPTTANAVQYARIVSEKALRRRLISAGGSIVEHSFSEQLDTDTLLDDAEKSIFEIGKQTQKSEYKSLKQVLAKNVEIIQEAQANGGKLPGLSTGYRDLDFKLAGLQKSDLIIIAARPSMGKTAFALNIAQNAALKSDARVVIFSLEMSETQLGQRLLAMESRVNSNNLRKGQVSDNDWASINDALDKLSRADMIIDDTPGIGVMEIRNKCRRINAERKIDLIVIDYLQMMTSDAHNENRQQEVTQISRLLKQLARELECPVVVLSQLSRAPEQRQGDHRPMLSDLRESGAIEQDADVVMFLFREDYYKNDEAEKNNICEVIIAKQRTGEVGTVKLTWIPNFTKFADLAKM